ncbi:MAG: hypothetical protein IJ092_00880 [Atopobiaceae bacterium]|nr:hypothetical protein [Atopobiaceae bacterium]
MHDHGGALDYDLMTMTQYTLDDLGGRLTTGALAHFVKHLPSHSETMRALFPEDAERVAWTDGDMTAQLLALLIDEVRGMQWIYARSHSRGSVRRPQPFKTPWTEGDGRGERHIGLGPITIAEFDAWFDGSD